MEKSSIETIYLLFSFFNIDFQIGKSTQYAKQKNS